MKHFITSILLLNCYLLHAQTQLGSDIDGEAADDWSGISVSINSAGDRVAIGGHANDGADTDAGHVRVYSIPVTVQTTTYVPDDNFEQALIDLGYDDVLNDSVLTANISGVTTLNVNNDSISDLTGIQSFTALTTLQCYNNQLVSLDVSNNTALTYLSCHNNQLGSLHYRIYLLPKQPALFHGIECKILPEFLWIYCRHWLDFLLFHPYLYNILVLPIPGGNPEQNHREEWKTYLQHQLK